MKYYSILLLFTIQIQAQEFIYPVTTFFDDSIAIMYQKSAQIIELYRGNVAENTITSGMYSRFMPSYIQALPGGAGFSFIDNGVIRIKLFYKRSPKALELYSPIYDINSIAWDTSLRLYVSAKHREQYALFQIDRDRDDHYILSERAVDFLYPQKVGNSLFFVRRAQRNGQSRYAVSVFELPIQGEKSTIGVYPDSKAIEWGGKRTLKTENGQEEPEEPCRASKAVGGALSDSGAFGTQQSIYYNTTTIHTVIDFQDQPIAFLSMDTEKSGFVVAHPMALDLTSSAGAVFSYYSIQHSESGWHTQKLFDFKVPLAFLAPEGIYRLYEYMAPLVPKKIDTYIYYTHADGSNLNLFKYEINTGVTTQLTYAKQPHEHYFGIVQVGNYLYCGGSMQGVMGDDIPLTRLEIR